MSRNATMKVIGLWFIANPYFDFLKLFPIDWKQAIFIESEFSTCC